MLRKTVPCYGKKVLFTMPPHVLSDFVVPPTPSAVAEV